MMAQIQLTGPDHVFEDGMTLKTLRDAIVAAAIIGMWHVARDLAYRYKVQDIICMKCGEQTGVQHTYFSYRNVAIRICLKCNGRNTTLPR
jgi:ribosomal protein L40E